MNFKLLGFQIVAVLVLLFLFYLSPFSELNFVQCISQRDIPNHAGAQLQPYCGYVLGGVPFPFRTKNSDFIEFCRLNIKTIELSCNENISVTLLIFGGKEYSEEAEHACTYFMDQNREILSLTKYSKTEVTADENSFPYKNSTIFIGSSGFDYSTKCNNLKKQLSNT